MRLSSFAQAAVATRTRSTPSWVTDSGAVTAAICYIALRFVQAYERRGIQVEQYHALTERVRTLEDVLDHVEDRVDRSDEVQRFTTSILAARLTSGSR